jgi:phosphoglycerate dehydrogenase-like enzyme
MTVTLLNAMLRPMLEDRLPDWTQPRWFSGSEQLLALAPEAEIGWFDTFDFPATYEAARRGEKLKRLNTLAAGVEPFPLDMLREKGVTLTNGAGLNAITIAEYAVMGMLTIAKGWREVVRAQERREWLNDAPGKIELFGSKALIIGAGGIGARIGVLLRGFDVAVTEVRRKPAPQANNPVLTPEQWRARLGEFDWVIIAVPSTPDTDKMIGAAELAAMKPSATVLNFARGAVIDSAALLSALREKSIAAAFLDVTDPEPLPSDDPLWGLDNCHISMHLSGRSQTLLFQRNAERFLENLARFERGEKLESVVDLALGY